MRWFLFLFIISTAHGVRIELGGEILNVEIANTQETRAHGLMGREELKQGEGMLFVYENPQRLVFWMKNTYIPLSIAFFDESRSLIHILDMDPPIGNTLIRYRSRSPALYALEVPQGWFEEHRIGPGAKFSFLDQPNRVE